ncbi:MAG: hypothetical protein LBR80_06070 [Deltaproteobacteria bacterium]|nr:hypothetical protein [Deltaproteobacteria bacterium]
MKARNRETAERLNGELRDGATAAVSRDGVPLCGTCGASDPSSKRHAETGQGKEPRSGKAA